MNDGVITIAGLFQGLTGADAPRTTVLLAVAAAAVAGALAVAGAAFDQLTAEREGQLALIEKERNELVRHPAHEIGELTAHFESRGVEAALARSVAEQLHAADPLGAQLETEYGLHDPMSRTAPLTGALWSSAAFIVGSFVPLLFLLVVPDPWDDTAVLLAAVLALALTGFLGARSGGIGAGRAVMRSVIIGVATLALSYLAGLVLL